MGHSIFFIRTPTPPIEVLGNLRWGGESLMLKAVSEGATVGSFDLLINYERGKCVGSLIFLSQGAES